MNAPSYCPTSIALLLLPYFYLFPYCQNQGNPMISSVRSNYPLRGFADLKVTNDSSFTILETSVLSVNIFDIKSRR